ncbi:MAG: hypothetical protein OXH52_10445 [Gammaproteobacteria bacterium]|nr:hypothetical protein [Gammaproteobacteria bacterium]
MRTIFSNNDAPPKADASAPQPPSAPPAGRTAPLIRRFLIPGLLAVLASPGPASAAEEANWLQSLFSGSDAVAEEGQNNVTPSHVFRATTDLIAEIGILRSELGVYDFPAEAEYQEDRAPVHVYAKTLEVLSKVAHVQRRFGLTPADVGQIPIKKVVPGDVLRSVNGILGEVRRIKTQMVIEAEIEPAEFRGGKTPSMVYKNLADASFLLDGLRGRPLTPTDVFGNAVAILDEMELIAAKLRVPLQTDPPPVNGTKRPTDVAQQVLRATYKVINLQTRLGMDASSVPTLTLVRVTPSEVYDATNVLMAEMNRIKVHLGINLPREPRPDARNKRPEDVFAQVMLIIQNLDTMASAASA